MAAYYVPVGVVSRSFVRPILRIPKKTYYLYSWNIKPYFDGWTKKLTNNIFLTRESLALPYEAFEFHCETKDMRKERSPLRKFLYGSLYGKDENIYFTLYVETNSEEKEYDETLSNCRYVVIYESIRTYNCMILFRARTEDIEFCVTISANNNFKSYLSHERLTLYHSGVMAKRIG